MMNGFLKGEFMKIQKMFFVLTSIIATTATADWSAPVYFVGEQVNVGKECFVELKYSVDQKQVTLRGVVTNAHEGELFPVGELIADYMFIAGTFQKNGYFFQDKTPQAPVKQMSLIAEDPLNPTSLTAAIFHDNHHDPAICENLVVAENEELAEALELFEDFEHLGEHDHAH
jgi:hypothetical protein